MIEHFTIVHVPIPGAGYIVRNNRGLRPHRRQGSIYWQFTPHSSYYETREEAEALRAWLVDRYNQYPVNLILTESAP